MAPGKASSGLSLERFMNGKVRTHKAVAKKRKRMEKAVLLRQYRKEKKQMISATATDGEGQSDAATAAPVRKTYYDKFFEQEKDKSTMETVEAKVLPPTDDTPAKKTGKKKSVRPDPYFKAKQAQKKKKTEIEEKQSERSRVEAEKEMRLRQRKQRKKHLTRKNHRGQPVLGNSVKDILAKLM